MGQYERTVRLRGSAGQRSFNVLEESTVMFSLSSEVKCGIAGLKIHRS